MAAVAPFDETERREVRDVARVLVRGEHPPAFLGESVRRWGSWVTAFLTVADREGGNLNVMPFAGGFLEQPVKTMEVLRTIQQVFAEKLKEEAATVGANLHSVRG